jgi:hypothetical protein
MIQVHMLVCENSKDDMFLAFRVLIVYFHKMTPRMS